MSTWAEWKRFAFHRGLRNSSNFSESQCWDDWFVWLPLLDSRLESFKSRWSEMWPIIKLRIGNIVEKEDSLQDFDYFSAKMAMNNILISFVTGIDGWTEYWWWWSPRCSLPMMILNSYSYVVKHQVRHHGHHPASMDGAAGGVFEQCCGKCLPQWVLLLSLNAKYHLCQCTMNLFRFKES